MIPKHKATINKNDISGKNIKVLILGEESEGDGMKFTYALWDIVKRRLEKDGYHITETVIKHPNYDNEIKNFKNNGYDMVVGYISINYRRSKFGNYTKPFILDQVIIGFEPEDAYETTIWYKIVTNAGLLLLIFSFIAILLSLLLYFFGNHYRKTGSRLKWHFFGVFRALLGEPGSVVEQIDIKNNYGIIISFLILLFMFIISLLVEAALTQRFVTDDIEADKDPIGTDIKGQKFLVQKGTSFVDAIKKEGGIPIPIDIKYNSIQDYYLKKKSQVAGFVTDLASWGKLEADDKYNTLVRSKFQFPYDEAGWIIEVDNYVLLDKVQQILIELRDNKTIRKICLETMPHMETINCGI